MADECVELDIKSQAQSCLNDALSIFNENQAETLSNSDPFITSLNFTADESKRQLSLNASIDLKSEIVDDGEMSDLWQMHSLHGKSMTLNSSVASIREENVEYSKKISLKKLNASPIKRLQSMSYAIPDAIFRFDHIDETNERIATFEQCNAQFIYFQGVNPPLLTFQSLTDTPRKNKLFKQKNIEWFRLLIPPCYDDQKIFVLECRKRRFLDKWRFTSNEQIIGKMKVIKRRKNEFVQFQIKRCGVENSICAEIKISVQQINESHAVEVILSSIGNEIEGSKGNILRGVIRNYVLPKLNLCICSSKRTVLNIHSCDDNEEMNEKLDTIKNVQMLDMDYPLSIFVSFAIATAIQCRHLFI